MTARNNRLTQLGRPCHSSPMTTTTNGARLSQYEVRHYATNLSAFAPDDDPNQGPGFFNDQRSMLGDPPGMVEDDYAYYKGQADGSNGLDKDTVGLTSEDLADYEAGYANGRMNLYTTGSIASLP